ncbi:MAG: TspO/MBR family protein [Thermoanaerobaculia bacterium]
MRSVLVLMLFLVVCFGVAAWAGQFTPGAWYAGLEKPPWNPPGWVFAPVWTVLYAMMAVAGWLVWRSPGLLTLRRLALGVFAVQLALNGAWSWLFFGLHRPGLALAEIVVLWLAIVATTLFFWRVRPLAGVLLLPYLAWVSFAVALNAALWRLNA